MQSEVIIFCVPYDYLGVATHAVDAQTSPIALIVATSTMLPIEHWIHTLPFTTYLRVLAFLATLPTIISVRLQIYTLLLATVATRAAFGSTQFYVSIACHRWLERPKLVREEAPPSWKRR